MPTKKKSDFEIALQIALQAHQAQKDRYGEPYILHPLRVMSRLGTIEEKIVALLHDVIEDSPLTLEELENKGFSVTIINAVDAMTKRPGEDYMHYITRVTGDALAVVVKLADLEDNMDLKRCKELTVEDINRMNKYLVAWFYLKNFKYDNKYHKGEL